MLPSREQTTAVLVKAWTPRQITLRQHSLRTLHDVLKPNRDFLLQEGEMLP